MLLSFPYMHPELIPAELMERVSFFDPGMTDASDETSFRPATLPMDPKTASALIADCINFGEQFKDPSEMAYFGVMSTDDFYEGSSMSIKAQLTQRFNDGQGFKEERVRKEGIAKAQFILLLAWFFEEKMIELASIEKGVKDTWKSMDTRLGMDDEDRIEGRVLELSTAESHTGGVSDGQSIPYPWKRIIEALPAFIPTETVLVCADKEILSIWDDLEIEFAQPERDDLPIGALVATLPAWKFAGRRNEPKELPFALTELTVAIVR